MEKLSGLLAECFEQYPLYTQLIPQKEKRKEILPELFDLDLEQYFEESEIYADSEALNGIIIVSDRRRSENPIKNFYLECRYVLETGYSLVVKDRSLKTLMNFIKAREYLSSAWQEDIEQDKRLHIEYFAVRPGMQGKGIASKLMKSVLHKKRAYVSALWLPRIRDNSKALVSETVLHGAVAARKLLYIFNLVSATKNSGRHFFLFYR